RQKTDVPVVFMTYYNPVFKYGLAKFTRDCGDNGADGVIIPDLPYEEAGDLAILAKREKVALIFLAAPTSTRERLKNITKAAGGFIYYVSLTGVTGARKDLPAEIAAKVKLIKSMTKKPVCVGFGISGPEQARAITKAADGVIVGSAIIKVIEKNLRTRGLVDKVSRFAGALARAIHGASSR
ncbi:MAG: tryptophan synthase subunit alpha, partial [Candidatus Omnitrophica bacterium]|nr:tryptophan synthase subunit alpha [Candidatus Omnitrophota bacterium]